jgi:hypothetical protein
MPVRCWERSLTACTGQRHAHARPEAPPTVSGCSLLRVSVCGYVCGYVCEGEGVDVGVGVRKGVDASVWVFVWLWVWVCVWGGGGKLTGGKNLPGISLSPACQATHVCVDRGSLRETHTHTHKVT